MADCIDTVVLTVGNSMMGDDGAGPYLTKLLEENPIDGWMVIDGGTIPENYVDKIVDIKPRQVIVVDATDMQLDPGELRVVDETLIADMFIMTPHSLPLTFLIEQLKAELENVLFLGIQPDLVIFGLPMCDAVKATVESLHARFTQWDGQQGGIEAL